jgi:hypothetical protein
VQLLCLQYSLLPTFKDVVEEWQATDPPYNSRRRIEATDVVENRIVGQPFPVADPKKAAGGNACPTILVVARGLKSKARSEQ